jgi:hypothetical protein
MPFADQDRTLATRPRLDLDLPPSPRLFGDLVQEPLGFWLQTAQGLLLDAVGHGGDQEGPAYLLRKRRSIEPSPLVLQLV